MKNNQTGKMSSVDFINFRWCTSKIYTLQRIYAMLRAGKDIGEVKKYIEEKLDVLCPLKQEIENRYE